MAQEWPVDNAAVAVVDASGTVLGTSGPQDREFRLASVTKLLTAYATLVAIEEGAIEWDQPAGPEGSTVRHLAAHASGLAFDEHKSMAAPGTRRMYSNAGFEVLADVVHESCGIPFAEYLTEAVFEPLAMSSLQLGGTGGSNEIRTPRPAVGAWTARIVAKWYSPRDVRRRIKRPTGNTASNAA